MWLYRRRIGEGAHFKNPTNRWPSSLRIGGYQVRLEKKYVALESEREYLRAFEGGTLGGSTKIGLSRCFCERDLLVCRILFFFLVEFRYMFHFEVFLIFFGGFGKLLSKETSPIEMAKAVFVTHHQLFRNQKIRMQKVVLDFIFLHYHCFKHLPPFFKRNGLEIGLACTLVQSPKQGWSSLKIGGKETAMFLTPPHRLEVITSSMILFPLQ